MDSYDIFQIYLQDRIQAIEQAWWANLMIVEITQKDITFSGMTDAYFLRKEKSLSFKLAYDSFTLEYNIIPCEPCNELNYINICEINKCIVLSKFEDTHFKQLADKIVYIFSINNYAADKNDNRQKAVPKKDTAIMPKNT